MTEISPTPGRRSNGLVSAEWGALVDLDPRLSEALLDSLAAEGVAAFVEPAAGVDTVSRAVTLPKRPLDRLWVDPARADQARVVVAAEVADLSALLAEDEPGATAHGLVRPVPHTAATRVLSPPDLPDPPRRAAATPPPTEAPAPAPVPLDDDEIFRQIVAGFADEIAHEVPPWPVTEDLGGQPTARPPRRTPDPVDPPAPRSRRRNDPKSDEALPGWLEPAALPDDGHFVPPPPPPVPRIRLRTVGASLLLALGLVLLFVPELARQQATSGVLLLGLVMTAGGAGLLVWWMRDAPPDDSGPDHGAVV